MKNRTQNNITGNHFEILPSSSIVLFQPFLHKIWDPKLVCIAQCFQKLLMHFHGTVD